MPYSGTESAARSVTWAVPSARPGDTPRPVITRSMRGVAAGTAGRVISIPLIECVRHQPGHCIDRGLGLAPGSADFDRRADRGRKHHQAHDRATADHAAVLRDAD